MNTCGARERSCICMCVAAKGSSSFSNAKTTFSRALNFYFPFPAFGEVSFPPRAYFMQSALTAGVSLEKAALQHVKSTPSFYPLTCCKEQNQESLFESDCIKEPRALSLVLCYNSRRLFLHRNFLNRELRNVYNLHIKQGLKNPSFIESRQVKYSLFGQKRFLMSDFLTETCTHLVVNISQNAAVKYATTMKYNSNFCFLFSKLLAN
jgi:hypothetical protein